MLAEAEGLIAGLDRAGKIKLREYKVETSSQDATALAQRVNAYRAISAAITEDADSFQRRLEKACAHAVSNVQYLLSRPDASHLLELEDTYNYGFLHLAGQRQWTDPLWTIADSAIVLHKELPIAKAYRSYIEFLENAGNCRSAVLDELLADARTILSDLMEGAAIDETGTGNQSATKENAIRPSVRLMVVRGRTRAGKLRRIGRREGRRGNR